MSATLSIIYWRDIPAQVVAKQGRETHRIQLDSRFQLAIDRVAMETGLIGSDDYLAEWRRASQPCSGDAAAEVAAIARSLEAAFPPHVLAQYVANGGFRRPAPGHERGAS
jgi:hypothetical protein